MTYAGLLQESYPELAPRVEDLFLLEGHQIERLPDRAPRRALAVVLHAHPGLFRFFVVRHPPSEAFLSALMADHEPGITRDVNECALALLWEIGDWIVYQRLPRLYDERVSFEPGLTAINDVAPVMGKVVIDAGAGTGQVAFAAAPVAKHVFAVEPVSTLRSYMRDKAKRHGVDNVFVMDGFLHDLPVPRGAAEVLLTRQAIGWDLDAELDEVERVLGPGGIALHLTGMPHRAGPDDSFHSTLVARGYEVGSYREGGTLKRRYWRQV
ncbi:MAG: class I SAM-dependent methyltransferase [bacterium]|nr:class I SAM-dependent methyltransferase [bacterium]